MREIHDRIRGLSHWHLTAKSWLKYCWQQKRYLANTAKLLQVSISTTLKHFLTDHFSSFKLESREHETVSHSLIFSSFALKLLTNNY